MDFACFVAPSTRSGGQAKSSYLNCPAEARDMRSRDIWARRGFGHSYGDLRANSPLGEKSTDN